MGAAGRGGGGDFTVRVATPEDDPAIISLLGQTLGWQDDQRHRALFAWKHRTNVFGASPGWLAIDEEGVAGFRTFMRWEFQLDGERVRAVRAVDTATHPRAQGKGIFRALTLRGVEEMTAEGVDWVFNTPNDRSAPGYLSMGWQRMGRLPVALRPAGLRVLPRLLAARQPGDLWSVPTSAGEDAAAALEETGEIEELLASHPAGAGCVRTERRPAYLQWRYGASPMGYRAMVDGSSARGGAVLFRLRRRGPAVEAVIDEVIVPGGAADVARRLCRRVLDSSQADYLIAIGAARRRGWLPVPGNGPLLTWRALARRDRPSIQQWDLSTGDVELF